MMPSVLSLIQRAKLPGPALADCGVERGTARSQAGEPAPSRAAGGGAHRIRPKVPIRQLTPQNLDQVQKVVEGHWKDLNQTVSNRAAIEYTDDFRSGLDAWESRSNLTRSWSYDAAGFVRPGPLAIFKPTVDLSDYRFEFLGEIDQKAMGWAFRAEDLNNYYAMKFVVVKPGPLPLVHIVRYAVINGKEGPHVDKPLPMTVRTDMLYRIEVNVRGSDFTILATGAGGRLLVRPSAAAWRRRILLATAVSGPGFAGWKFRISTMRWADFAPILRPTELRAETGISTDYEPTYF